MDNYEKQVYTGRKLFLKYDQDKLIEKYGLKHDEEYLYLKYIGIGSQSVIVSWIGCGLTEQICVNINSFQDAA